MRTVRTGEEKGKWEEEAVEVEIYSGIEFTRLNSTPPPHPPTPVQEHMVQINWLPVEKRGRRKEGVSE